MGISDSSASETYPLPCNASLIVPRLAAQELLTVRKQLVPLLAVHDDARQWPAMPVADNPPRPTLIEHLDSNHGRLCLIVDVLGLLEELEERLSREGVAADRDVGRVCAVRRVAVCRIAQSEALAPSEVKERALIPNCKTSRGRPLGSAAVQSLANSLHWSASGPDRHLACQLTA